MTNRKINIVIGFVLIGISLSLYLFSYLSDSRTIELKSFDAYYIGGIGFLGLLAVLRKLEWVQKIIDKKLGNKNEQ